MKKITILSVGILLCIFMASCVGGLARPYQRKTVFVESDYLPYTKPGKATIIGQAFAVTRGGEIRYAAGKTVYLYPATSYADEYFEMQVVRGMAMSEADKRFIEFEKTTVSDATGMFEFKNLAPGKYYAVTEFGWCAGRNAQYIILGAKVEAKTEDVSKVILPEVRQPNPFVIGNMIRCP